MKRIFTALLALAAMFFASNAYADKITIEEAAILVNKAVPGKIVKQEWWRDDRLLFYDFDIEREDGTLLSITFDPFKQIITSTKVEKLGEGAELPPAVIPKDTATGIAVRAVGDRNKSIFDSEVESADYTVLNKKLVYSIVITKGSDDYTVIIDAMNGEIISFNSR